MLKKLADSITFLLLKNDIVEKDDIEIYSYGLEVLMCNIITAIIIFALGIMLKTLYLTFIFTIIFCVVRSFTGGYHAKTFLGCLFVTVGTYFIVMLACLYIPDNIQMIFGLIFLIFASIITFTNEPIVNQNKPKTKKEINKCKNISQIVIIIILIVSTLIYLFGASYSKYFFTISCSLMAIAVNILIALRGGDIYE